MDSKANPGDPSKLNDKQRQFVREYLIDLNATQAAIRCGYSAKTAKVQGSRLLTNVAVQAAIQIAKAERAARKVIDQDYVLDVIQSTIDRCRQAEPVLDKTGQPTGEYKFDASAVLKGAELLGRHLGTWNDKIKLQGDANDPIAVVLSGIQGAAFKPVKAPIDEDEE
jgi:phage terminase small subunit